jgi:hypothetical protein
MKKVLLLSLMMMVESFSSVSKPFIGFTHRIDTVTPTYKNDEKCEEYYIYLQTADSILSNYKTKMTGKMMADAWHQTLENYNVDVPLKLALAQAHLESGFGQSDLSSRKNNPYSLRSGKSYATFNTLQGGVSSYYKTIATKYLKCKTVEQLLRNFSTCQGYRYAGSKNYEVKLRSQMGEYDNLLSSVK